MQIQKDYVISLFLDSRRQKQQSRTFPVKLRVFCSQTRKTKLYSTKFEFENEKLFESIWKTEKPRKVHEETRLEMQAVINAANDAARTLAVFTFEGFEKAMKFNTVGSRNSVYLYYDQFIDQYKKEGRIGTASNYNLSARSVKLFTKKANLTFSEITPTWLNGYENFMISEGKSITTISMYLRSLKSVFNAAIADKAINPDLYPFGRRKYTIPAPKGTKRALSREQLKTLWEAEPKTPEQEFAKDFFFFSYQTNGLNVKDICLLKYKNISGDQLTIYRQKTKNTDRGQSPISIFLIEPAKEIIIKYGNQPPLADSLIFPFISPNASPETMHREVQNLTRKINQHIKKLAKSVGIEENISSYFARHSFATNAIRTGFSVEAISEALGHTSITTTKAYFSGFEDKAKRELAESLMKF